MDLKESWAIVGKDLLQLGCDFSKGVLATVQFAGEKINTWMEAEKAKKANAKEETVEEEAPCAEAEPVEA